MRNSVIVNTLVVVATIVTIATYAEHVIDEQYKPVARLIGLIVLPLWVVAFLGISYLPRLWPSRTPCKSFDVKNIPGYHMFEVLRRTASIKEERKGFSASPFNLEGTGFVDVAKLLKSWPAAPLRTNETPHLTASVPSALTQLANRILTQRGPISHIVVSDTHSNREFAERITVLTGVPTDRVDPDEPERHELISGDSKVAVLQSSLVTVDHLQKVVEYVERSVGATVCMILIFFDMTIRGPRPIRRRRARFFWCRRVWHRCPVIVAFTHNIGLKEMGQPPITAEGPETF